MFRAIAALTLLKVLVTADPAFAGYVLRDTGEQTSDPLTVHIRGVGAPLFNATDWTTCPPHLVADVRHPLIEPRQGKFRNIYAPSAVPRSDNGWYVYYGGWDGLDEGRDGIYVTSTDDFAAFGERKTVILPGPLQHVCNVNGQLAGKGGVTLMCTAYPDAAGLNKPVLYNLPTVAPAEPVIAGTKDMVSIEGYDYTGADINGMNVLLRDGDRSLLYFGDFRNFGAVRVATGDAPTTSTFRLSGTALDAPLAVNDVKILRDAAGKKHYLMGLHMNRGELYYALSDDPLRFTTATELLQSAGEADKHIVALGWVTDKDSGGGARKVLGVLYGAGAAPTLDANRIFSRWIQKKLEFDEGPDGAVKPKVKGAFGPSTAVVELARPVWNGQLKIEEANGTPGDVLTSVTLTGGRVYEAFRQMPYSAAFRNRRGVVHQPGQPHDPNCDCPELPWVRP